MTYPSKRDWWISVFILPIAVGMLGLGLFLISLVVAQVAPVFVLLPGLSVLTGGVLFLWLFLSTSYEVTESKLIVRFGPMRWALPLDAITEIIAKKGLSADRSWGFAWSLDRLVIRYRKRNGKMAFLGLAISPADKEGFLRELAGAVAGAP